MLHTLGVSDDCQASPLVETKLHIPSPRRNLVARPRLQARLAGAADVKLVLVSAPAGFGKTTLVTEWLRAIADDGAAVRLPRGILISDCTATENGISFKPRGNAATFGTVILRNGNGG